MAFWRSAPKPSTEQSMVAPVANEVPGDPALQKAMDLAAGLLRDWGRTALDVEGVASETIHDWCENWAEHLLIGAPRPGDDAKSAPIERRDWIGARRFFAERRREETAFVSRSLAALQKAVWSFIQVLDGLLAQDDDSDSRLKDELTRLKAVAESGSAEILRKEVLGTVEEIGRLAQARHKQLREKVDGLSTQVHTLCSALEVARQESATDGLTRVYNRKAFDDRLEQAVAMARLFGQTSSLLLVDIDQFKVINDTFGHVAGDTALREVADCLVRTFRVKTELVARYGGDEFAVLQWDTPIAAAKAAADKILAALRSTRILHEGDPILVSVSVGVSQSKPGESSSAWIERTDRALYAAKSQGGGKAVAGVG